MRRLRSLLFAGLVASGLVGLACSGYDGGGDARIVPMSILDGGPGGGRDGSSSNERIDGRAPPGPPPEEVDVSSDLFAYWRFDEDGYDSTGSGRNLSTSTTGGEPLYVPGRIGSAARLADVNDQFHRNAQEPELSLQGDLSLQAWVRVSDPSYDFLLADTLDGNERGWMFWYGSAGPRLAAPQHFTVSANVTVTADEWHHVIMVFASQTSTFRLWHDGVLAKTVQVSSLPSSSTKSLSLGPAGPHERFIDEVAIWLRALEEHEVRALYNGGAGRPVLR